MNFETIWTTSKTMLRNLKASMQKTLEYDSDARLGMQFLLVILVMVSATLTHIFGLGVLYAVAIFSWFGFLVLTISNLVNYASGKTYFRWSDEFPALCFMIELLVLSFLVIGYISGIPIIILF